MARLDPFLDRVVSHPMTLHWAGWETTTARLQQAGWEMAAEQHFERNTLRIAFSHPQWGARGITETSEYDYYARMNQRAHAGPEVIHARMNVHMGKDVYVRSYDQPTFSAIDARPQIMDIERITCLEDLAHFAPQATLTSPFVLPEPDVDELLSMILAKQQAAKTEYFRDLVARDGQVLPAHRFHAQIISLREAA